VEATVDKIRQKTVWREIDAPTIYANVVGVGSTPYDVNFILGEIDGATAEQVNAKPLLKVILSPELAANLATLLNVVMESYVSGNGPLRTIALSNTDDMKRRMLESAIKIEGK
jgi:hypothetical protein